MSLRKEHKVVVVRCCDAVGRVGTGQDTDALALSGLGAEKFPVIGKEVDPPSYHLFFVRLTVAQRGNSAAAVKRIGKA